MKLIAVSQRIDIFPDRNETRDDIDQGLIYFLLEAGYLSVPVPNVLYIERLQRGLNSEPLAAWLAAVNPTAIVLSGGNNIGEHDARDLTEGFLLNYAEKYKLPVFGICRGMQMMAHWGGAKLKKVSNHARTRHQLYGQIITNVNSYHDYSLISCPENFKVLAHSEDGEIEAIRHISLPWEGWMWHPEREENFRIRDLQSIRMILGE
jgi:gamma-glutamyl-gamma-aminobutyrate hydrolase PuuD